MNLGRRERPPGRRRWGFAPLLLLAGLALVLPGSVGGQVSDLATLQARYDAAKRTLQVATDSWVGQERIQQAALAAVDEAQRLRDANRLEVADRAALEAADELLRLRTLAEAAEVELTGARNALMDALEAEMFALERRIPDAPPREQQSLTLVYNGYDQQHQQLRTEAETFTLSAELRYLPQLPTAEELRAWPIEEIRNFIDVWDRRIADFALEIERADEQIASLERRIAFSRRAAEGNTTRGRFGQDDPVGAIRPRNPGAGGAGALPDEPLSPEDELALWKARRAELDLMRHSVEVRMAEIRPLVPRGGGGTP